MSPRPRSEVRCVRSMPPTLIATLIATQIAALFDQHKAPSWSGLLYYDYLQVRTFNLNDALEIGKTGPESLTLDPTFW